VENQNARWKAKTHGGKPKRTVGGQDAWWEAKTRGEKPKRVVRSQNAQWGGAGDSTRVLRCRGGFENVLGIQISGGEIQTGGGRSQPAVGGSNE
jgi:hypothetical protein